MANKTMLQTKTGRVIEIEDAEFPLMVTKVFETDEKIITKVYKIDCQAKGIGFMLQKHEVNEKEEKQNG